jgi:hypothetical protein
VRGVVNMRIVELHRRAALGGRPEPACEVPGVRLGIVGEHSVVKETPGKETYGKMCLRRGAGGLEGQASVSNSVQVEGGLTGAYAGIVGCDGAEFGGPGG